MKLGGELDARGYDLVSAARPLCESLAERYFADRYPGFDVVDEDWPHLIRTAAGIRSILEIVERRVATLHVARCRGRAALGMTCNHGASIRRF